MLKILIWRLFSLILLFMLIVPTSPAIEPPPERDIFTVAVIGDRTGGDPAGLEFLERAVYEINQLNPDFVIHLGDMVQGYTRDQDEWLREYEEFMSYMDNLDAFWYPVAGNHDVSTPIWDTEDRTYEELYKKHFGLLRYSFDYKNSHFIIMYTDDAMTSIPSISSEQMEWLRKDLESAQKTNIFIFMHKPLWRYDDNEWDTAHEIIKEFPVRAVIAGHFHTYQKDVKLDGIQYYVMGPAGGEVHDSDHDLYGYFHHYSILRIEDDRFTMAVVKLGNVESDDYVLADDNIRMRDTIKMSSSKTGVRGWLWQPRNAPVEEKLEIYAYNPLNIDIPVTVRLNPDNALWSMEPPTLGFILSPDSDIASKVILSSPAADPGDIVPPEFEFEYMYTDTHGRKIPLIIRRRVFLRDTHEVHGDAVSPLIDGVKTEPFWQQVSPLYNHTWIYSVYESHDDPPKIYLAADDANLYFFAEVVDDEYSYLKDNKSRGILSDAIIFSTLPPGGRKEIVIFPFNEDGSAFTGKVDEKGWLKPSDMTVITGVEYTSRTDQQAGYYYCEGKIPLSLLFGDEPIAGKELPFNVGVIDNDLEAFMYLRTWAFDRDPQYWGILRFSED